MNDFQIKNLNAGSASIPQILEDAHAMRARAVRDAVRAAASLFVGALKRAARAVERARALTRPGRAEA